MKSAINKRETAELDELLKSGKPALILRKKYWQWQKEVDMAEFKFNKRSNESFLFQNQNIVLGHVK